MHRIGTILVVFLLPGFVFAQFSIQPLPPLDPAGASYAHGINALGQVVGESLDPDGTVHAVIWENGVPHALDSLRSSVYSTAYKINNHGQIAGLVQTAAGDNHAAYWDSGGLTDIGTFGGPRSVARDINDNGVVVGSADLSIHHSDAFTWTPSTGLVDHGNLNPEYPYSNAAFNAVSNTGLLVGQGFDFFSPFRAARENPGESIQDIGYPGETGSQALGVNDAGTIVGYANRGPGSVHAAIFDGHGDFQDLGSLDVASAWAQDINNHNLIVGYAFGDDENGDYVQKAFIYQNGEMTDLWSHIPHKIGWEELDSADAVNDAGQIVGWGVYQGEIRAFIITVPEPANLLPLSLFLLLLPRPKRIAHSRTEG